jgi:hypothetical protein
MTQTTSPLVGSHALIPTTDPDDLARRAECAAEDHPRATYNPWHDATWCRCGALVTAGNSAPIPTPRKITPRGKFDRPI